MTQKEKRQGKGMNEAGSQFILSAWGFLGFSPGPLLKLLSAIRPHTDQ